MRFNTLLVALALLTGCAPSPRVRASAVVPAAPATKPTSQPAPSRYRLESVEVFGSRRYSREELLAVFGVPEGRDVGLSGGELHREARQGKEWACPGYVDSRVMLPTCRVVLQAQSPLG